MFSKLCTQSRVHVGRKNYFMCFILTQSNLIYSCLVIALDQSVNQLDNNPITKKLKQVKTNQLKKRSLGTVRAV